MVNGFGIDSEEEILGSLKSKVEFVSDLLKDKVSEHFQELNDELWKHSNDVVCNETVVQIMDQLWSQTIIDISHQIKENLCKKFLNTQRWGPLRSPQ